MIETKLFAGMQGNWRRRGSDDRPETWRSRKQEPPRIPSLEPTRRLLCANSSPINLVEPAAFWSISADFSTRDEDGLAQLDRVWSAATELVREGVFLQASCYTPGSEIVSGVDNRQYSTCLVHCYVENYLELDRVVTSADEFRKRVDYPYPMYLRTNRVPKEGGGRGETLLKYLYCADGNIYENGQFGFKIVRFTAAEK